METARIKALCDYLLGYWELEIDDDDDDAEFNDYFKTKYNVDEFNMSLLSWREAHIELSNLLYEHNRVLSEVLLGMAFVSSSRNDQNMKRVNTLLEELYKKI
jgi:hypothetical protein